MSKRLRDPVHGLIVFSESSPVDMLAWKLIDTSEFQRLRRIRQLGVSEFTFPGAVHTRFAHSIGVFHNARALVQIIEREMIRNKQEYAPKLAEVAQIAALLHDVGHGPFSHTFEGVQKSRHIKKEHEEWTAEIISNPSGNIEQLLNDFRPNFCSEVAALFGKKDPTDIYHAVVSSSFDADRLDYLQRDKLMTGTGAGAIDIDWLMDNVRVAEIDIGAPDEDEELVKKVATFCLDAKALPAAEQFLFARYTLHQQVYFHKATRCVEHMIGKMLRAIARHAAGRKATEKQTGLKNGHPLIRFFAKDGETVANYLALDDALVFGALEQLSSAEDPIIADMAKRLHDRKLYKTLDLAEVGQDTGTQTSKKRRITESFKEQITAETVMLDEKASISIYSEIGGDDERMHKKLHVLNGGIPEEISKQSDLIRALEKKKQFTRFYFENKADRDRARGGKGTQQ